MNKKLVTALTILVLSGIITSETALARKRYYDYTAYADTQDGYRVEVPYEEEPIYQDEVIVEEQGDRGRSVAKGVGIGAVGGGLLGLAASGGKGKGFGYGALAGAGFGGLIGACCGRKKRYRRVPVNYYRSERIEPRRSRMQALDY